jgi:hypothetical protein
MRELFKEGERKLRVRGSKGYISSHARFPCQSSCNACTWEYHRFRRFSRTYVKSALMYVWTIIWMQSKNPISMLLAPQGLVPL